MPLQFAGPTQNGTSETDYLTGWGPGGSVHTLSGADGNDFLIGDIGIFFGNNFGNTSIGTALDINPANVWSTVDNPLVFDSSIPWMQIHILGENAAEYFVVTVGAGETITVDTDAAGFDTAVHIVDGAGNVLAENDDGGHAGDTTSLYANSTATSFISYTNTTATDNFYYVRVGQSDGANQNSGINGGSIDSGDIASGNETMLYVSVTNHVATGSNTTFNTGDDVLDGGAGDDQIFGMGANDLIFGGAGTDYLHGGEGYDTVAYSNATSGVYVDLEEVIASNGYGTFDEIYGFEAIAGSSHNDLLYGDDGSNTLMGSGGDDFIDGRGGADLLVGGAGNDSYIVNTLGDTISEFVDDGIDIAYTRVAYTLEFNVEIGVSLQIDTTANLSGNSGDNTMIIGSTAAGNTMDGGAGDDVLYVLTNTTMIGGTGNDILISLGEANTAQGNAGDDIYINSGTVSSIAENFDEGMDTVYLNAEAGSITDLFLADNVEIGVIIGTPFQTRLYGNGIDNTLIGSAGSDAIAGFDGSDFLIGGVGDDVMIGGRGLDVMQGNTGADEYYYNGTVDAGDIIQDFVSGEDAFVFAATAFGFMAGHQLTEGVDFIKDNVPAPTQAIATFLWDADDTALYYDADGTGEGAMILIADLQDFSDVSTIDIEFA